MNMINRRNMYEYISHLAQIGDYLNCTKDKIEKFYAFNQFWGSDRLGFGGMGCSIGVDALTTVIITTALKVIVFFNEHPAYTCDLTDEVMDCIKLHRMPSQQVASEKFTNFEPLLQYA